MAQNTYKKRSKKTNLSIFSRLSTHRGLVAVAAIMLFSGIGTYFINSSDAAAVTMSRADCEIRGRKYSFIPGQNRDKAVKCADKCQPKAGRYTTKKGQRGYCNQAVAASISKSVCIKNGRKYVGDSGCARRWTRNQSKNVVQCNNKSHIYWVGTPDYCAAKKRITKSYVGRDGFGGGQCTDYVKHILSRHSPRFRSGTYGNGVDFARNLGRLGYTVNNTPAVRAVVSMRSSQSAGHVAIVAEIKPNGSIVVEEANWSVRGGYGRHTISASAARTMTYAHTEVDWR